MNIQIDLQQKVRDLECDVACMKHKLQNYRAISAALVVCVLLLLMVKAG